jgi:hypothetical protein
MPTSKVDEGQIMAQLHYHSKEEAKLYLFHLNKIIKTQRLYKWN